MTSTAQRAIAIVAGVAVLGGGAFFLLSNRDAGGGNGNGGDISAVGNASPPTTKCPLSGDEPNDTDVIARPAIAVKIENSTAAFPLSGLEDAEVVYEELVEGGITRFMAIYHCTDTDKAGPIRSSRAIDPAIMSPITRVLAAAGGNEEVLKALKDGGIVLIDESAAGEAMRREPREGVSAEHTLYGDTSALREVAGEEFSDVPAGDLFTFGELQEGAKPAKTITIQFSGSTTIGYEWSGENWVRSHNGAPFVTDTGDPITADNVLIEEHDYNESKIVDVLGNPSTEIGDVTGSGRAVLFRDAKVIEGVWKRESEDSPVVFETASGDDLVLKPGNTFIELVPSDAGQIKGSFSFAK